MTYLRALTAGACLLAGMLCFAGSNDEIYKWVNEKGQIHYGNNPPVGSNATLVNTKGGPSEEDVAETKKVNESIEKATAPGAVKPTPDPAEAQAKQEACDKAKAEYEKIAAAGKISVKNEQGEYAPVDSEKRAAMVEEQRALAEKACAP